MGVCGLRWWDRCSRVLLEKGSLMGFQAISLTILEEAVVFKLDLDAV